MSLYRRGRSDASRAMDAAPVEAWDRLSGPDTSPGQGTIEVSSRGYRRQFRNQLGGGERTGRRLKHWADEWDGVGWRVMDMIDDQRSSAHGVARMVNLAPPLADQVVGCARALYERGPVRSTAHAIILIGFRRLQRILELYLDVPLSTTAENTQHWGPAEGAGR